MKKKKVSSSLLLPLFFFLEVFFSVIFFSHFNFFSPFFGVLANALSPLSHPTPSGFLPYFLPAPPLLLRRRRYFSGANVE
jgi:hypothetical protein